MIILHKNFHFHLNNKTYVFLGISELINVPYIIYQIKVYKNVNHLIPMSMISNDYWGSNQQMYYPLPLYLNMIGD